MEPTVGRKALPKPTDAELEILRVLWRLGPATVRRVHDELSAGREMGYTTVLKLMQIMAEKRLVVRDESARSHVYSAAVSEDGTQGRLLGELMDKLFGGSAAKLALRALSEKPASAEELAEVRKLLEALEAERVQSGRNVKGENR
jgi:predicted transcriptional regulator